MLGKLLPASPNDMSALLLRCVHLPLSLFLSLSLSVSLWRLDEYWGIITSWSTMLLGVGHGLLVFGLQQVTALPFFLVPSRSESIAERDREREREKKKKSSREKKSRVLERITSRSSTAPKGARALTITDGARAPTVPPTITPSAEKVCACAHVRRRRRTHIRRDSVIGPHAPPHGCVAVKSGGQGRGREIGGGEACVAL